MGLFGNLQKIIRLEVTGDRVEDNAQIFRLYCLIGAVISPIIFLAIIPDVNEVVNTTLTIFVPTIFIILYWSTHKFEYARKNIGLIIFIFFMALNVYGIYNLYSKEFSHDAFVGFMLGFFVISMAVQNHIYSLVFTLFSLFTASVACAIGGGNGEVSLFILASFIVIIGLVAYVVLIYRTKIIKKLGKSEKYMSTIFDNSYEAILLVDFFSRKVVDCNEVAVKLFEVASKNEIIGKERDIFQVNRLINADLTKCRQDLARNGKWTTIEEHESKKGRKFYGEIVIVPLSIDNENLYITRIVDITERLSSEAELHETNEKLSTVLNSIDHLVYSISIKENGEKEIQYISPQIKQILGLSVGEYISASKDNTMVELYHPDDLELIKQKSIDLKESKKPVSLEYRFKPKGADEYIWIEEKVFPRFNEKGEHIANFGIASDISERIKSDQVVKLSEERYRTLFERNLAGVYRTDMNRKLLECNDSFAQVLGYKSKDEIVGKNCEDIYIYSSDKGAFIDLMVDKKSLINHESKIELINGSKINVLENATLIYEGDEPMFVEGTMVDISELKNIEHAFKESEETLSMVLDSIDDLVYNVRIKEDGSKEFRYISPQIKKIIGLSADEYKDEVLKGKIIEYFHPDDLEGVKTSIRKLNDEKKPITMTYRYFSKDIGKYVWLEENIFPKIDEEGNHIANMGILRDVTSKKEAEQILQQSEEQFRNLFEEAPIGMAISDLDGKLIKVNNAFIDFIEYSQEELLELSFKDISHPDDIQQSEEQDKLLLSGEVSQTTFEKKYISKSGNYIHTLLHVTLEKDEFDQPKWFVAQVLDITKNKQAQEALKVSEERYRTIFERNLAGVFRTTVDGKILECNDAFARILGFDSREDVLSRKALDLYFDKKDRENYLNDLRKKGELTNYEICHKRKDGSKVWVLVNVSLSLDEENNPEYVQGTLIDITELKTTGEALIESEEKFRLLFSVANDAIFIMEQDIFIDCNEKTLEMFACKKEEIVGLTPYDFSPEQQPDGKTSKKTVVEWIDKALKSESQFFDWRYERKDGTLFDAEVSLNCFELGNQKFIQAIVRDITERKVSELALKESEDRFKLLSEVTMEGIVITENKVIIDANDQFALLHGYSGYKEVMGMELKDFVVEEEMDDIYQHIDEGREGTLEVRSRKKTGEVIVVESRGEFIPFNGKRVRVSVVYNITERKKYEQDLKISQESFRNLVEHSPDGILIHIDGIIEYANPSALQLFGMKKVNKMKFWDVLMPEYKENIKARIALLKEGKIPAFEEVKVKKANGEIIELGIQSVNTIYQGKKSIHVILHNQNIKKQLAKEQLRAQIAEEANKRLEYEINEHKNTQQKLKETQKFTRNIIDSSLDMIMATNTSDTITEVNFSALEHFGYNRGELIGQEPKILYSSPEEYERVRKELSENGEYTGEIKNLKKDGTRFTSYLAASMIRNDKGKIVGAMGVSRDITEIKKAEEELKKSEDRYRDLFENATDFIQSVDTEGNFIYVNNSWKKAFGYSDKELQSLNVFDIVHPSVQKQWQDVFDKMIEGEHNETINTVFVAKNGQQIMVEGNTSVRYKDKRLHSIRGIFRDVTDAKLAEQKIQEQSSKIQSIFESASNMMIWTLDIDYNITSFNNNFAKTVNSHFGLEIEIGDNFINEIRPFIKEDLRNRLSKSYKAAIKGDPQEFEGPLLDKKGRTIWIETFLNPIKLENGTIREISCLAHEITDKKLVDRQIRQSLKEKEVLLKEVHHRVKNNLQVISSILNLQSSYVKDQNTLNILRESQNRIKSMSFIHESLYQTKNFSSINFSEYILNLSKNLVHSYQIYGNLVELEHDLGDVHLNLDQAIPCGLIINELVSNALKYAFTEDSGGKLYIGIKEKANTILLEVEDNGVGLPDGFDYKNTESLGLQLVVTLVEQLDGELELKTKKGTKYLITFDRQKN
jgi:PAS domain S-box-containing protein